MPYSQWRYNNQIYEYLIGKKNSDIYFKWNKIINTLFKIIENKFAMENSH